MPSQMQSTTVHKMGALEVDFYWHWDLWLWLVRLSVDLLRPWDMAGGVLERKRLKVCLGHCSLHSMSLSFSNMEGKVGFQQFIDLVIGEITKDIKAHTESTGPLGDPYVKYIEYK